MHTSDLVAAPSPVRELDLTAEEAGAARALVDELCTQFVDPTHIDFLERAVAVGLHLPSRVLGFLSALRHQENFSVGVITGFPIDAADVAPTPFHWRDRPAVASAPEDFWLTLTSAQLGDLVSWTSLQDGRLLSDIHPIAGHENEQTGHSSTMLLDLHVEDAFHDCRCDNLTLLCLRNPDAAATAVVDVGGLDLSAPEFDVLFKSRFLIAPDDEHRRNLMAVGVAERELDPVVVPVLHGCRTRPNIRLDPPYMRGVTGDIEAARALELLMNLLPAATTDVVLKPGDLLLIDNHRALHGRRPFRARYDGTDRWLRRATTVRDLRPSRSFRSSDRDRVIHPVMAATSDLT